MSNSRYRCVTCGNMTRFDVVVTRRFKETYSFEVDGVPSPLETEVTVENVDHMICGRRGADSVTVLGWSGQD